MNEKSNSFFVRTKNKLKTFFRGEKNMLRVSARVQENMKEEVGENFLEKMMSAISSEKYKYNQYKGKVQSEAEVIQKDSIEEDYNVKKRSNFLSMYKVRPKDTLKDECPTGFKVRRDRKYNGLKGKMSKVEAMRRANEETTYYNNDPEAREKVEIIKIQGNEIKWEQKINDEK